MKARVLIFMAVAMLTIASGALGEADRSEFLTGNRSVWAASVSTMGPMQTIDTWGSPQRGQADAPVTIAVFSDFQ